MKKRVQFIAASGLRGLITAAIEIVLTGHQGRQTSGFWQERGITELFVGLGSRQKTMAAKRPIILDL
jgi:hypothetical protein